MEQRNLSASKSQKQLFFKIGFILLLILSLLIPMTLIENMISERAELQRSVEMEVAASWGKEQIIQAPVLCIPYQTLIVVSGGKPYYEDHVRYLAPEDLKINSIIASETRERGIFSTVVFTADNQISGSFNLDLLPKSSEIQYNYAKAVLVTGITDPTAITNKISSKWNEIEQTTSPGIPFTDFAPSGFFIAAPTRTDQKTYTFNQTFTARGTAALRFLPSGKTTDITVKSNWPSPSFTGRNLPVSRTITVDGFSARWSANEYNRPFADTWSDKNYTFSPETGVFGVSLLQTADFYQKNMRSAKYAILVITLSFLIFFFYEMLLKVRIHPIQYIMIGLSLAIFYALLLSFTEHIGFNQAYLISFIAVVSLIAIYAYSIIKKRNLIAILCGLFTMLYAYIFVLLQLEDYALLAGSVGLFAILAVVMLMSRKIDWYKVGLETSEA